MATRGYSRFITWIKIILPVLTLGLLSSLVLFSKKIDPQAAIPFAETDIEDLAQNQRIGSPTYSTVTSRGAAITITALSALPDQENPNIAHAEAVHARIEGGNFRWADLKSEAASVNTAVQQAEFDGNVEINTAQGYRLNTSLLSTDLSGVNLTAPNTVTISGPKMELQAGNMHLSENTNSSGMHLLVFKQGVKLIYQP